MDKIGTGILIGIGTALGLLAVYYVADRFFDVQLPGM